MSAHAASVPLPARLPRRARSRLGLVGLALVALFAAAALAAPGLSPYGVHALAGEQLEPPSRAHPLGTNAVGQDLLSHLLSGARVSLVIALLAGTGTLVLGAVVGLLAGWRGGLTDAALMRLVDVVLVVPRLPLLIVIAVYAGTSVTAVAAVIALTSWAPGARVIRAQVLSLRPRAHLRAAVGFGASTFYVLRRHVVPEIGLILAAGFVAASERAVMLEAGLSFLGLGDPLRKSWGTIMRDALDFEPLFFTSAWSWWLLPPVAAVSVFLLGLTFVGVALEERINPRLVRHAGAGR